MAYELADVRDAPRLERVFDRYRPQVVVHLAAAKHVQYGQRFPEGAVATNVLATKRLLELAAQRASNRFVYPSSDKSVDPPACTARPSGWPKHWCSLVQPGPGWSVVRYVNIIGTRGSVIETFTQQILDDRPLSVTDDRMTRYWISMNEALWCLILAAERGQAGEVLMPACGEPVAILETARRLAAWYRPSAAAVPDSMHGHSARRTAARGAAVGERVVRGGAGGGAAARSLSAAIRLGLRAGRADRGAQASWSTAANASA